MELRHLRYFVAIADAGHVTRAAAALGIGQPPLSQQIQALERELGLALFERLPRGVRLTEAGRAFAEDARRILREVEQAGERARRVARGEVGRIRVGMINSAPFHPLIPRLIREFRRRYPNVALTLEERLGWPVDVECAWQGQALYLLQCRPITTLATAVVPQQP